MANKQGKAKENEAMKLAVLTVIREKKEILFGKFSTDLEKTTKEKAWKDVLEKAQSIGLCNSTRKWEFVRDSLWGTWKARTLSKRDNSKKTGTGGGKTCVFTPVDNIILEIIGKETPGVIGLSLPQTGEPVLELGSESLPTPSAVVSTPEDLHEAVAPPPKANHSINDKYNKKKKTIESLKRKRDLQIELLEMEIYHKKLCCAGLERQLRIRPSDYTKEIVYVPPESIMIVNTSVAHKS